MNSSDAIAIVAIVVSAIVSIMAALVSYLNNRAGIQARRLEMAFERRLEAVRQVSERLGALILSGSRALEAVSMTNEEESNRRNDDLKTAYYDFFNAYAREKVYLPPNIVEIIIEYGRNTHTFFEGERDVDSLQEWFKYTRQTDKIITSLIHESIGLA